VVAAVVPTGPGAPERDEKDEEDEEDEDDEDDEAEGFTAAGLRLAAAGELAGLPVLGAATGDVWLMDALDRVPGRAAVAGRARGRVVEARSSARARDGSFGTRSAAPDTAPNTATAAAATLSPPARVPEAPVSSREPVPPTVGVRTMGCGPVTRDAATSRGATDGRRSGSSR
jgi:hypothetical protein